MSTLNERIKRDVVNQLVWDNAVDASQVKVEVIDGRVILTGTVPLLVARRAAQADAMMVPGVTAVDNQLVVRYPMAVPTISDDELCSRARKVLQWNADTDSTDFRVSATLGRVSLEGSVDAYWKKMRAEQLVSELAGVLGVINSLAVVPTGDTTDRQIAEDILAALDSTGAIDVSTVNVQVENGMVTLSGSVPGDTARRHAGTIVANTEGVTGITNNLAVEQPGPVPREYVRRDGYAATRE